MHSLILGVLKSVKKFLTFPPLIELSEYLRNIEKIDIHLTSETGETLEFGDGAAETRLTLHILSKSMLRKS